MKLSTMLCLAVASGKLFGSLWKAEDQESPARTPSLGVSEEISDLVDIETGASPLRRLLKEAESDSTEAEDDESSNDENIDEDDEEDEDGTEDNNGFMQNRAVQLGGAGIGAGLVCGAAAYYFKEGASVKTPQGITVTVTTALDAAMDTTAKGDKNVLKVSDDKKTIYTSYATLDDFKAKYGNAVGAAKAEDNLVFALQKFEEAELTTIQKSGTAPKASVKDRVILTSDQYKSMKDGSTPTFGNKMKVDLDASPDSHLYGTIDWTNMIITKAPDAAS